MANRMYAKTVMTETVAYGYAFAYSYPACGEK